MAPGPLTASSDVTYRPLDITDADHDGQPYVLERVLGTDPNRPIPNPIKFALSATSQPVLEKTIVSDLVPVGSSNISIWQHADSYVRSDSLRVFGGGTYLTTIFQQSSPQEPKRFFHLRATRNR